MRLIRQPDKRDGIYEITPADAARILQEMKKNRPLSELDAKSIAKDIEADQWVCNGETIILNGDGSLLDGQHRLRACVLANKPIQSYVVWDFGSTVSEFDSLDQGKMRNAAHRLALDGVEHYTVQAGIVRLAIRYDDMVTKNLRWLSQNNRISPQAVRVKRAKMVPQIDRSASLTKGYSKQLKGLCSVVSLGFVHAKVSTDETRREKADAFVHSVATGEGLSKTNPVLALRSNLISKAAGNQFMTTDISAAMLIKTWNAYVGQRQLKIIRIDPEHEPFPRFQ